MKELLVIIDVEAWRFFIMKRATAFEFTPCSYQAQTCADNTGQRQAITNFFEKGWGKRH
jgi:hypothetical protein